jgi:hypothetical protein
MLSCQRRILGYIHEYVFHLGYIHVSHFFLFTRSRKMSARESSASKSPSKKMRSPYPLTPLVTPCIVEATARVRPLLLPLLLPYPHGCTPSSSSPFSHTLLHILFQPLNPPSLPLSFPHSLHVGVASVLSERASGLGVVWVGGSFVCERGSCLLQNCCHKLTTPLNPKLPNPKP